MCSHQVFLLLGFDDGRVHGAPLERLVTAWKDSWQTEGGTDEDEANAGHGDEDHGNALCV